jgi:hypothetical protein
MLHGTADPSGHSDTDQFAMFCFSLDENQISSLVHDLLLSWVYSGIWGELSPHILIATAFVP